MTNAETIYIFAGLGPCPNSVYAPAKMTTSQWFDSIEKTLAEAKKEDTRLKAGIKCAAPKLRKHLKELATLSKAGRQEALDRSKSIPKKVPKRTASAKTPKPAEPEPEPEPAEVKA